MKDETKEQWKEAFDVFTKALEWLWLFPVNLLEKLFSKGGKDESKTSDEPKN
jgi:hypothetical protein